MSIIEYVNTFEASSFLGRKYLQKSADDGTWEAFGIQPGCSGQPPKMLKTGASWLVELS